MLARFLPAALLASAAPLAAQDMALPVTAISGTRLDIVATGESKRVPDLAVIGAGVVTQAADAASAMRDNAARMERVVAALRRAGVAARDIQTTNVSLQPQYRYGENQPPIITGYQAANTVTVRFREIARSGAILDVLVREGANTIDGPNLTLDRPEAALDEARGDAVAKARARAELYARAAGLRVKRMLVLSEAGGGYAPPRPPGVVMLQARDVAETKVLPGEQTLGVTITVSFELE